MPWNRGRFAQHHTRAAGRVCSVAARREFRPQLRPRKRKIIHDQQGGFRLRYRATCMMRHGPRYLLEKNTEVEKSLVGRRSWAVSTEPVRSFNFGGGHIPRIEVTAKLYRHRRRGEGAMFVPHCLASHVEHYIPFQDSKHCMENATAC